MSDRLPTLDELKAMEKAATPGPWTNGKDDELYDAMRAAMPHLLAIAESEHMLRLATEAVVSACRTGSGLAEADDAEAKAFYRRIYAYNAARAAGLFGEVNKNA